MPAGRPLGYSKDEARVRIRASNRFSIADAKNEVIAHIDIIDTPAPYWVDNLWVAPDHRRHGLAGALLERVIARYGQDDLYLSVVPYTDQPLSVDKLARWYQRFGFAWTAVPGIMHRAPHAAEEAPCPPAAS